MKNSGALRNVISRIRISVSIYVIIIQLLHRIALSLFCPGIHWNLFSFEVNKLSPPTHRFLRLSSRSVVVTLSCVGFTAASLRAALFLSLHLSLTGTTLLLCLSPLPLPGGFPSTCLSLVFLRLKVHPMFRCIGRQRGVASLSSASKNCHACEDTRLWTGTGNEIVKWAELEKGRERKREKKGREE